MARRKLTAAEYIESQALLTPLIIGDMIEHLGTALQSWGLAVEAARRGDLDRALTEVVAVEINCDIPLKVGRGELRAMMGRAGRLLDLELPDDHADLPAPTA
jgi:hypothetical protein